MGSAWAYFGIGVYFLGSILAFLVGKFTKRWNSFWVAVITGLLGLVATVKVAFSELPITSSFTWFEFGELKVNLGLYIDGLSLLMALIATGIGFLDIIFSRGYMEDDESPHRYYFKKLFFIGSMVGLVFVNNLVGVYIFWEGVGLCSYLLIGYWYWKKSASEAALKAFVMTRFGDVFMLAGIVVAYVILGTVNLQELNELAHSGAFAKTLGLLIALLLFVGAIGKSAQFPLFPWLLDAMEGPTTVSALIHAATMVNAGVYLVARLFPFFEYSNALPFVAFIGAISAFIAATGALAHTEIKKILAFSTMEHLALMFVGIGVGAVGAGVLHLLNHAVFKALLFLSAGAVIHMAHHVKDAFKLGGLFKKMPQTAILFLVGVLALSGIPPFNGFFSKDWILVESFYSNPVIFGLAFTAGVLCVFYGFRLWFVLFTGPPSEHAEKAKEAYPVMLVPLYVLALFTLITAFLKEPVVHSIFGEVHEHHSSFVLALTMTVVLVLFLLALGIYFARVMSFNKFIDLPIGSAVNTFLFQGWMIDRAILWTCRNVIYGFVAKSVEWIDTNVVDGAVNGVAHLSLWCWKRARKVQTGDVVEYLRYFALGMVIFVVIMLIV